MYAETIPNFEVLTLVVFASGVLLGARDGAMVGGLTMLVYSLLNPYGAAHPLVTLSQVLGEMVPGWVGGMVAHWSLPDRSVLARSVVLGLLAVGLTACFDLVTNVATGLVFGQMRAVLLGGLPFSLWHIASNLVLFAVLGPPLVSVFGHYRARLLSSR